MEKENNYGDGWNYDNINVGRGQGRTEQGRAGHWGKSRN